MLTFFRKVLWKLMVSKFKSHNQIIYYAAKATTEDTQEDIFKNCNDNMEETEGITNEMVSNMECTVHFCHLGHDKSNQPTKNYAC